MSVWNLFLSMEFFYWNGIGISVIGMSFLWQEFCSCSSIFSFMTDILFLTGTHFLWREICDWLFYCDQEPHIMTWIFILWQELFPVTSMYWLWGEVYHVTGTNLFLTLWEVYPFWHKKSISPNHNDKVWWFEQHLPVGFEDFVSSRMPGCPE